MKYKDEYRYAGSRLVGSVVRFNGKPVMVDNVDEEGRATGYYIKSERPFNAHISNMNLDPVPLGYINTGSNAVYIARQPKRNDWRQGMRFANVKSINSNITPNELGYKCIAPCIMGEFPNIEECQKAVANGANSMAFSRRFSIGNNKSLSYRGKVVGKDMKLLPKYAHLSEQLSDHSGGLFG